MEVMMNDSILTSVKLLLGIAEDYAVFDQDLIALINSAFSVLFQLGVGDSVFSIQDSTATWNDFSSDTEACQLAKEFVFLRVQLNFDPPSSSYVLSAKERMLQELTWRINVAVDPKE